MLHTRHPRMSFKITLTPEHVNLRFETLEDCPRTISRLSEQVVKRVLFRGSRTGNALRAELIFYVVPVVAPCSTRTAEPSPDIFANAAVLQRVAVVELYLQYPLPRVVSYGSQFTRTDLLHFHGVPPTVFPRTVVVQHARYGASISSPHTSLASRTLGGIKGKHTLTRRFASQNLSDNVLHSAEQDQ